MRAGSHYFLECHNHIEGMLKKMPRNGGGLALPAAATVRTVELGMGDAERGLAAKDGT